jgi:tripartite-type tricarboxylate transporter receptor subunit TctC
MKPIRGRVPVLRAGAALLAASFFALFFASLFASPASADSAADFYKGKQLRILIGYGPGTGYDVYGRVLGRDRHEQGPVDRHILQQVMQGAARMVMVNDH